MKNNKKLTVSANRGNAVQQFLRRRARCVAQTRELGDSGLSRGEPCQGLVKLTSVSRLTVGDCLPRLIKTQRKKNREENVGVSCVSAAFYILTLAAFPTRLDVTAMLTEL